MICSKIAVLLLDIGHTVYREKYIELVTKDMAAHDVQIVVVIATLGTDITGSMVMPRNNAS